MDEKVSVPMFVEVSVPIFDVLRWKYRAAQTNSADFLAQMDYPGTRKYIEEVLRREQHYRRP